MNLFNISPAMGNAYLTPKLNYGAAQAQQLDETQAYNVQTSAAAPAPVNQEPWWETGGKILAAAPLDLVDNVVTLFPGLKSGDVNDAVYNTLGMPAAAQWVRENKGGVDVAAGLAGAVGVGMLTDLALGRMASSAWFTSSGLGRAAMPLMQWVGNAENAAKSATLAAAASGDTLSWLDGANLGLMTAKVTTGALKAGVSEAAIAAALHNNSAVWSDDMTQNLLFAGLGIGLGAAGGLITGRAYVKRWANSPEVQKAFATAADPSAYERLGSDMPTSGLPASVSREQPKDSAQLTAMMLNARNQDVAPAIGRAAIATQTEIEARTLLQRIGIRGTEGVPESKFTIASRDSKLTPEGRQLTEALHDDPTLLYGADSLAKATDVDGLLQAREDYIKSLESSIGPTGSPVAADRAKALQLRKQVPLVVIDKTLMPVNEAKPFIDTNVSQIAYKPTATGPFELQWEAPSGSQFVMREDGGLNKNIDQLTIPDLISVGEAGNKIMDSMLKRNHPLVVQANPNFMQIDFATKYAERGGTVDWSKSGLNDLDAARVASMQQKAARIDNFKVLDAQARYRLNLPQATSEERVVDPNGDQLRAMVKSASMAGATTQDLLNLKKSIQKMTELTQDAKSLDSLEGNFFEFNRSSTPGRAWNAPVVGFFEEPDTAKWTKWALQDSIAENRAVPFNILRNRKNAPVASSVAEAIAQMPDTQVAMGVSGLANSQLPGTSNVIGASASQFLTQAMRNRFTPVLQAAQNIRRVVNRLTEQVGVNASLTRLKPFYDRFSSIGGQPSRVLFNQYLSNSAGWDIAGVKALPDGKFGFLLDNTESNAARLGRDVQPGELMTNRNGTTIVLDDLGNQARQAFEAEFKQLLKERNAVREARGLAPIKPKNFFVPPPSTAGKRVGFTLDSANRVVPGGAIVAGSDAEFRAQRAALQKRLQPGQRFMTLEQIRAHSDLWDQAQLDFIDPTKMAAPTTHQTGKIFSDAVDSKALENAIQYLKSGYEQVAAGTVRTLFEPQLTIARVRHAAEAATQGIPKGTRDIWQEYVGTLMGLGPNADPRGINEIFHVADKVMDAAIGTIWGTGAHAISSRHVQDVLDKIGYTKSLSKVRTFSQLASELGPYMPFKDAMDYAAYTHKVEIPTAKDFGRLMNRIGAAVVLRWLEIPQAAMNMAGIITNMPGLLNATNVPVIGRVKGVPIIDQMKIMARGFQRMVSERSGSDWAQMVKNGDTSQDAMDIHRQLSLLDSRGKFMKFMAGDPSATGLKKLGVEGVASYLTDTSESLSRVWAHFVGLELADLHGVTGLEARHTFARSIANDAIANYDPLNRPEIFNSAFGNMYGLFLSYAQNYYQRMFRFLEDEDYKAFGTALAMQAAMFGFTGIPGARQLGSLLSYKQDKGDGLVDGIYERFGPALGSVVAGGGFNQLVTLFGLPAVSLNTRGDINFRHPTLDFITSGKVALPIGLEVLKDITTSTFQSLGSMVNPNVPHSAQYIAEIAARNMPNRMLHGALSVLAAGGKDTDANGNLVSDTNGIAESVYRMLGLRSARQQAQIEAYFENKQTLAIDAARMQGVRDATRALIRGGKYDQLPQVFNDYLNAGGKPWNYQQWLRDMIKESNNTRTSNQLLQALRSPGSQVLAKRIQLYTGAYE